MNQQQKTTSIIRYHKSEVHVTTAQMTAIATALKTEGREVDGVMTLNSPVPLLEICLEDYGVDNNNIID